MKLIKETYDSWGAEVVFITSNYQGTQEMMEGCKEAGVPAFVRHRLVLLCLFLEISFLNVCLPGNAVGFLKRFPCIVVALFCPWQQDCATVTRFIIIHIYETRKAPPAAVPCLSLYFASRVK